MVCSKTLYDGVRRTINCHYAPLAKDAPKSMAQPSVTNGL